MATSSVMNDPAARAGSSIANRSKVRYGGDGTNALSTSSQEALLTRQRARTDGTGNGAAPAAPIIQHRSGGAGRLVPTSANPMPISPPTRRDNIITARADGTFNAKRDAFNAGTAQHGKSMDEAGNITVSAAARPAGQLVPGRSAGSLVMQPGAAAPAPAPQAPNMPAAPAPASPPVGIRPPAPMGPPSTASASAGKMTLTPQPVSRLVQRQQRQQSAPGSAPAPIAPPSRKPGMINDGNGFRPASEVNAGLRAAQESPAAAPTSSAPSAPATAAAPSRPRTMADWTPEEEKAALAAARARSAPPAPAPASAPDKMPQIPSPKPGLDTEAINRQRAKWESQQRLNPNQKLNAEGNPDPNGFTSFDEAAKSLYGEAYAPPPKPIQPPSTGKFPTANPSTVSGKPRYVPPGSKIAVS